jgi:hypothetical protein
MQIDNLEAYLYSIAYGVRPQGISACIAAEVSRLSAMQPRPGWYHQHNGERIYYFNPATGETCWDLPFSVAAVPHQPGSVQSHPAKLRLVSPGLPTSGASRNDRSFVLLLRQTWMLRPASGQHGMAYRLFEITTGSANALAARRLRVIDAREYHIILVCHSTLRVQG